MESRKLLEKNILTDEGEPNPRDAYKSNLNTLCVLFLFGVIISGLIAGGFVWFHYLHGTENVPSETIKPIENVCVPFEITEILGIFSNTWGRQKMKRIHYRVGVLNASKIREPELEKLKKRFQETLGSNSNFARASAVNLFGITKPVTYTYSCPAYTRCVEKQLLGVCGGVRLGTAKMWVEEEAVPEESKRTTFKKWSTTPRITTTSTDSSYEDYDYSHTAAAGESTGSNQKRSSEEVSLQGNHALKCHPEEQFVTIRNFYNTQALPAPISAHITIGVKSGEFEREDDMAQFFENMKTLFVKTLGISAASGYDWSKTAKVFSGPSLEKFRYNCPGRSVCTINQLVGICGHLHFGTSMVQVQAHQPERVPETTTATTTVRHRPTSYTPLGTTRRISRGTTIPTHYYKRTTTKLPKDSKETAVRSTSGPGNTITMPVMVSEGKWIIVQDVSFGTRSGMWGPQESCPKGTYAHGFKSKGNPSLGLWGFGLICASMDAKGQRANIREVTSLVGRRGSWNDPIFLEDSHANGFVFQSYQGNVGSLYKGNWRLEMSGEFTAMHLPSWATEVKSHKLECGQHEGICGIKTMLDTKNATVTDIGFKCCRICKPIEKNAVKYFMINRDPLAAQFFTYNLTVGSSQLQSASKDERNVSSGETREAFVAHFGNVSPHGYNWDKPETWAEPKSMVLSFDCPTSSTCSILQLTGYCGEIKVVETELLQPIIRPWQAIRGKGKKRPKTGK